jgi:hypothetical protein
MANPVLDDLTYDVITVLKNKAEALEAYETYLRDAAEDEELLTLFRRMRRDDEEHVRVLKEALSRRLDEELGYSAADGEEDYDGDDEEEVESSSEPDDRMPPPRRGESRDAR